LVYSYRIDLHLGTAVMAHISRMRTPFWVCIVSVGASLVAGCGQQRPEGAAAPPAQRSEESFKEFGPYQLHYNAVRSDTLTPEVARAYGIERSKNRVLLNVTVLRKEGASEGKPVEAAVSVDAYNLNGQRKDLPIRRVNEGSAIYYIGETGISGAEILAFNIKATPVDDSTVLEAKLRREFFSD
jgi:hypothetical protein